MNAIDMNTVINHDWTGDIILEIHGLERKSISAPSPPPSLSLALFPLAPPPGSKFKFSLAIPSSSPSIPFGTAA